ncbi:MAG: hypothetical protein U0269_36950 [Polyangiales bacterium]
MDEGDLSKARRRWARRFDKGSLSGERWTLVKDRGARHRCAKRRKGQPKRGYGACFCGCAREAVLSRIDANRYCAAWTRAWGGEDIALAELPARGPIERGRGRWRR